MSSRTGSEPEDGPGRPRFVVSLPALYWHVRELAWRMVVDDKLLTTALQLRKKKWVQRKPEPTATVPLRASRRHARRR